jgi:hypothetical protein
MPWGDGSALCQLLHANGYACTEAAECALGNVERTCIKLDGIERVVHRNGNANGSVASPRRRNGPALGSGHNAGVPEIVEDMSARDIVATLQHLRLPYEESSTLLRLDRGCRDYLVTCLRR